MASDKNLKLNNFNGINVEDADTYISPENCVDCSNIVLNNPYGTINADVGMSKLNSVAYSSSIIAIHQLPKHNWTNGTEDVFCFVNGTWTYGWPIYPWTAWTAIDGNSFQPFGSKYNSTSDIFIICDSTNHKIIKTDIKFNTYEAYGSSGSGVGQFSSPVDAYYDASTEFIYVCDYGNKRIVKTKIDGSGWETYGTVGSGTGEFNSTYSIYYDSDTEFIYISDDQNNRIVKTKIDGTGWDTLALGFRPSKFYYDSSSEYFYICSSASNLIRRIKFDGSGSNTHSPGTINPIACFYDSENDYLYYTDIQGSADNIGRITWDTKDVTTFGTGGSGEDQFSQPTSITLYNNYIYIGDWQNNRMIRFHISEFDS